MPGFEDEVTRLLTAVVNIMAHGAPPAEVRSFLCGASLAALPKEGGDHRPVAVGETMRHLVGKYLAAVSKEDAQILLEPCQVGVGTRGSCEAAAHVACKRFAKHAGDRRRVLAQIDLVSAFNTVERHALLQSARGFPSLCPWVDWS